MWKAEKSTETESQEPVKKRKVESQVKKSEKKSPKLSPKRRTPQADSFGPDFKKTVKETRKLQVFENDDIWE